MKGMLLKIAVSFIIALVLSSVSFYRFVQVNTILPLQQYNIPEKGGFGGGQAMTYPKTESYVDIIKTALSSRLNTGVSKLTIAFNKEINSGYLCQVLFSTDDGLSYEGIVYMRVVNNGSWIVVSQGCVPINKSVPFTKMELAYATNNSVKKFFVISGVINDRSITYINIGFNDGLLVKTVVKPTGTYAIVRDDTAIRVKYIQGFSKDGRLIYSY